jgi:hypothetical protein
MTRTEPIEQAALAKRRTLPAEGEAERAEVDLLDVALDERAEPRIVRENGRLRVVADVGAEGLDVARPFPNLTRAALNRRTIGEHLEVRERTYDGGWNGGSYWQYIGYPGELSSGERPAFQGGAVVSSKQDFTLNGNDGSVLGHFNEFTLGQSGGPAWGWWADEPWPRVVGVGSTIGSTAVQQPTGSTIGDNEYGGGPALTPIISWARANRP